MDKNYFIVGLSGKRSAGKDSIGKRLIKSDEYVKFSFAGPLKQLCQDYLGVVNYGQLEADKAKAQEHLTLKGRHPTYREVLQYVGTDIFRKMYPDVWANKTIKDIEDYASRQTPLLKVVATDVRFPNEVKAIEAAGGIVIRLYRDVIKDEFSNHASETSLDDYPFTYEIYNQDMTLDEQFNAANTLIEQFKRT
jgi:hypothetical protein